MTKKRVSLIQAIVQLIAIVSLFIPISFIRYFTKTDTYQLKTYNYSESLVSATDMSNNLIWGILIIFASIVALTYFVLYFATNIQLIRKNCFIAIPCIALPLLLICVIVMESAVERGAKYSEVYGTDWGFYLICALYVSLLVLELYKRFSKIDEEKKISNPTTTVIQNTSAAEEIKQFKELLDNGVITQEEFDAKKKELLGL